MYFKQLHLKAFGNFTDCVLDLTAQPHQFHIIHGENESGKSTTLRAITSLLYGFHPRTTDAYLHGPTTLRVGATLVDGDSGRTLEVVRRKGNKGTLLTPDESDEIPESAIVDMIGGVSQADFTSRFGLSHDELVDGGQSILKGEGDLGEILFAAGAGIGRLRELQQTIEKESGELFKRQASKPAINMAISELASMRARLREKQVPTARYRTLKNDLAVQGKTAEQLEQQVVSLATSRNHLAAARQALPLLPGWRAAVEADQATAAVVPLDERFTQLRREATDKLARASDRQRELSRRIETLQTKAAEFPVDEVVVAVEREIESLQDARGAVEKEIIDRENLLPHRARGMRQLRTALAELSVEIEADDVDHAIEQMVAVIAAMSISDAHRTRIIRLSQSRGEIVSAGARASRDLETIAARMLVVASEIDELEPADAPESLANELAMIGDPAEAIASHEALSAAVTEAAQRCDELCGRLGGFSGAVDEAARLTLPSAIEVERLHDRWEQFRARIATHEAMLVTQTSKLRDLQGQRRSIDVRGDLPSEQDLVDSRAARDRLIDETEAATLDDRREQIKASIANSDGIVDTLRQHRERVLRIEQFDAQVAAAEVEIHAIQAAIELDQDEFAAVQSRWAEMWDAIGIRAESPDAMRSWTVDHGHLVAAVNERDAASQRLERHAEKWQRRIKQLQTALPDHAPMAAGGIEDLARLLQHARRVEAAATKKTLRRVGLVEERQRLQAAEQLAREEAAETAAKLADWQQQWASLTRGVGGEDVDPAEVVQRLHRITELAALRDKVQLLFTRIRSMTDDETAFVRRVDRLAKSTGEEDVVADSAAAMIMIARLHRRLQSELTRQQTRRDCMDEIKQTRSRLAEAEEAGREYELTLTNLCREAGADDPEQLPTLERAAAERRRVVSERRQAEDQLRLLAGERSVEEFVDEIKSMDPAALELQIAEVDAELESAKRDHVQARETLGGLRNELAKMDGSDDASSISQNMQMVMGSMQNDVQQFVQQRIQLLLLARAVEHYRQANESPVLKLARDAFKRLTLGKYVSLRTDQDAKGKTILTAVPADGSGEVPANLLSTGTADALYLAMRLASLEHQIAHATTLPLVVDDCLVQLDDARSAAAMSLLSDLSTRTQVVMFTHHQHLVELAKHTLPPGAVHIHHLASL